jgi:hypothetical protein
MITYKDSKGKIREKKYDSDVDEINLYKKNIYQILNISGLNNLQKLWLNNNKITEINGLDSLTNLQYLNLNDNKITEIKGLDGLIRLQELWLSNNQITEIKGLNGLASLQDLWLGGNKITEINGLNGLINLIYLDLCNNKITEVPFTIMNFKNLNSLHIDIVIHPIIQRFLDRNRVKTNKTIYDDSQNVHNSNIVKSVEQSIYNIINESKDISIESVLKEIVDDKVLSEKTKSQLVEYCLDKTIHSLLNLTFDEVLCSVWKIIIEHKECNEIKKILNEEMKDSICKCFTGRLSRLVNCLNGFDNRVSIKINDKEQILNIIIRVRNTYKDVEKQKEVAMKELLERGFDKGTIDEYLIYLE